MKIGIDNLLEFLKSMNIKMRYMYSENEEIYFKSFCALNHMKEDSITWIKNIENIDIEKINNVGNLIVMVDYEQPEIKLEQPIIYVENVKRTFFRVIEHYFSELDLEKEEARICSTAIVETNKIGKNVYIGHHSYIGKDVIIGDNVRIYHNVTIQGKCEIGDETVIESGATIGVCGYGYYSDEEGIPTSVPHLGGIKIGKYVKIGANTAIARGSLDNTIIQDYVKIDNLCHIAHNVCIKKGSMIVANTVVCGSVVVGENVWTAPGSLIKNGVCVGDNSFLGLGTVATRDVPEGKVVAGVPFRILKNRELE